MFNIVFYLLTLLMPFGIALQNILFSLIVLLLLPFIFTHRASLLRQLKIFYYPTLFSGLFLLWAIVTSLLNSKTTMMISEPVGYMLWFLMPLIFSALPRFDQNKLGTFFNLIMIAWGLVVLSQALFYWCVEGIQIVVCTDHRPRGFYSHPLTLSYAVLILWPFILNNALIYQKKSLNVAAALATLVILLVTQSRTVQVVALAITAISFLFFLKGKWKIYFLVSLFAVVAAGLVIPNPVGNKLKATFSKEGVDRHSAYADDRMAFFYAHVAMFKERPLLGHGFHTNETYRTPYYDQIGLKEFTKKYPAHNMFLQILVNFGVVGLLLFAAWVCWYLLQSLRLNGLFLKITALETIIGFLLAALTQNSFQDASVRMILTIACIFFYRVVR